MKYTLKNGYVLDVPETIDELSLEAYLTIRSYVSQKEYKYIDTITATQFIVEQATGYSLDEVSFSELVGLGNAMSKFSLDEVYNIQNFTKNWHINDGEYACKDSFDELIFKEVFFIKQLQVGAQEYDWVPKTLATLIRPYTTTESKEFRGVKKVILTPLEVEDIGHRSKLFMNMKCGELYQVVNGFRNWEAALVERFSNLYSRKEKDINTGMALSTIRIHPKWAMISMLESLTGSDVSKNEVVMNMNYIECLTILSSREVRDEYYSKINRANGSK